MLRFVRWHFPSLFVLVIKFSTFFFLVRVDSESFPNFLFLFLYITGGYVRIKNEKEKK